MGRIRLWLEGLSAKPEWVTDEETGAAVQIDQETVDEVRSHLKKALDWFKSCVTPKSKEI